MTSFLKSNLYTNGLLNEVIILAKQANIEINWTIMSCAAYISLRAFEKALIIPVYGWVVHFDVMQMNCTTCVVMFVYILYI